MDGLLAEMPSSLFAEWQVYDALEPIRPDYTARTVAGLSALTANINRDLKKRSEPFRLEEFLPGEAEQAEPEPADPVIIWRTMRTWALLNRKQEVQ